jgi:DNA-binding transcriptional MerR regulator
MKYTVKKLAEMAGVSVRTLHYYDQIGLLKPRTIGENGYRYYGEKEVLKLQEILFFKELDFPLEQITDIMNNRKYDRNQALQDHKAMLEIKEQRIVGLLMTVTQLIESEKGGETMNIDDVFNSFGDDQLKQYQEEAKNRWGNTDAYRQSLARTKHWTKQDYEDFKMKSEVFVNKLAAAMNKDIKSPDVQALVQEHYDSIKYFYDAPTEMYRNLADMYIADSRFTEYYDKHKSGLAQWLHDAIHYYCDQHQDK